MSGHEIGEGPGAKLGALPPLAHA